MNAAINDIAGAAYSSKVIGYLACLLGLCVLFYYGTIQGVKSRHQPVHDEGIEVASMARSRPVGRVESAVVLPVKNDTSQPDYVDANPVVVHRIIARAQVSIDESLDPDADHGIFYSARLSEQENTGVFLDIDGEGDLNSSEVLAVQNAGLFLDIDAEPSKQSSYEIPAPQNVGVFLDVDGNGSDSYFDAGNESIEVNTGKSLNPDFVTKL